jgi:hypothetical protein
MLVWKTNLHFGRARSHRTLRSLFIRRSAIRMGQVVLSSANGLQYRESTQYVAFLQINQSLRWQIRGEEKAESLPLISCRARRYCSRP